MKAHNVLSSARPGHQYNSVIISARELQVLQLIANELTIKEIGVALFISHHTVVSHRKHLLQKLCARNTAGLIRRGFELELLSVNIRDRRNFITN